MLAKPEFFSPPDEVCCWPERCGEAAGTGAATELLIGQGAAAEKLTGQGATAEVLTEVLQRRSCPAEALWQNVCWPGRLCWVSAGRGTMAKIHREDNAGRGADAESHRETNAGRGATAKIQREESYLTKGVQLLLLCCIFAGKRQVAEVPAVPGDTGVRRSACRAWKAAEVQKAFGKALERICFACNK